MMSRSYFKSAVFAFAFTNAASASLQYTLATVDNYSGTTFWDGFEFITDPDPTQGFVSYQSKEVAESSQLGGPLIKTFANGSSYMGVDYWNKYATTAGRPSVRIETTKPYQYGLFVADLAHMPASVCGTWPAFWTVSHVEYPSQGEIDILENIHENTQSIETLHTSANCSVVGNQLGGQQYGKQASYSCDDKSTYSDYGSQSTGQGCSATNSDPHSYGSAFNANSGGVYAMEWTSEIIQIWNFAPNSVPSNLKSGNPDTSTWGEPQFTTAKGSCDIDTHFKDHHVVFNTDFCGSWAGLDYFWEQTSCYKSNPTLYPTCNSYVAANPAAYKDAYWTINSLKVYQKTNVVSSSSSSTHSSTTTSKSSSTSTSSTISTSSTTSTTSKVSTSSAEPSTTPKTSTSNISSSQTSISTTSKASTSSSSSKITTSTPSSSLASTTSKSTSISSSSSVPVKMESSSSSSAVSSPSSSPISSPASSTPSSSTSTGGKVATSSSSLIAISSGTAINSYSSSSSSVRYGNTSIPVTSTSLSTTPYTTSTVYSTSVYTVTSCAPTVTNCHVGHVTTEIISLYTTVCPVTATETSTGAVSTKSPYSPPPPPESVTSTVYTTSVYTITSCAPTVTNCPGRLGQVTTETISLYTTVCPYTPKGTHPAYPVIPSSVTASSPVASPIIASSAGGVVSSPALSAPASSPTVVMVLTKTVQPVSSVPAFSTISKISNSTIPAGTSGASIVKTSSAGGVVAPSQSPIYSSAASDLKVGGVFAVLLVGLGLVM